MHSRERKGATLTHPVGVLGHHGVGSDVLDVGDEQVAVLRPPHRRGVHVPHDEPEEVASAALYGSMIQ